MKSAVTISLVPEARGGPFVFWDELDAACRAAREFGFDAIELFPTGPELFYDGTVASALERYGLKLAAVGTGAGWVKRRLSMTSPDESVRQAANQFVWSMIEAASSFGAPAIVGSIQGRWTPELPHDDARRWLREALEVVSAHPASRSGTTLLYEPLNRYETNLSNTLQDGLEMVSSISDGRVKLLADLFHMNIEERDLPQAILGAGRHIGHVHLADSNRRPAGFGHTDFAPIAKALREIGYEGYVSAECLPYPDSVAAARATIDTFNLHFRT